jgi:hypothetical protein
VSQLQPGQRSRATSEATREVDRGIASAAGGGIVPPPSLPGNVGRLSAGQVAEGHPAHPLGNRIGRRRVRFCLAGVLIGCGITAATAGPYNGGPGGPILVVTNSTNPFAEFYAEILLTEGLNEFALANLASVSSVSLTNYDVVILGEMALTAPQVTTLSNWVNAGGKLITMRPDKQLAGLLGWTDAGTTLAEGCLLVNTSNGPGVGIVGVTMQFHGTADGYTLGSATSLATLYSSATTATANPAVTLRTVGTNGGQAAAFAFDLARSIVYTRQGNPAWVDQDRDALVANDGVVRSDDLFYGAAASDPQPDWVDPDKVAIPQADEQQRLLANLILSMSSSRKLLPRFWYFPHGHKAVVVMTGDEHSHGGTVGRFDQYQALSSTNGSVADWETIRGTSFIYPDTPMTDAQALAFQTNGFEISLHLDTGCSNYTRESLTGFFTNQLNQFAAKFPSLPPPTTHRMHCIAWSGYTLLPEVEALNGIRLDASYYYWPAGWVADRPGVFTGSGMPMRFATTNGNVLDVYQAATQMTDESGQSYPYTANVLLDRALGEEGYYGAFVANIHTDFNPSADSDAILMSATNRGVPVISTRQLLTWLDARNGSSFGNINLTANRATFSINANTNAKGLLVMAPVPVSKVVTNVLVGVTSIPYSTSLIKGVMYAVFPAQTGDYRVDYAADTIAPVITAVSPTNGAGGVRVGAPVAITFSEAMNESTINGSTITLSNAPAGLVAATVTYNAAAGVVILTPNGPLAPATTYTLVVKNGAAGVKDAAGNTLVNAFNSSFTTADQLGVSLWDDFTIPGTTVPGTVGWNDPEAVELGVRFQSDVNGYVAGIRCYQSAAESGTHIGNLWTEAGANLASVTFTNSGVDGWQYQAFNAPVAIGSNTTYVASYYTPTGHYCFTANYFQSAVTNYPLRALGHTGEGGNGVYAYTNQSAFPTQTANAINYWVDVVLVTNPFTITSIALTNDTVTLTWTAIAGKSYRLQYRDDLANASWTDLTPDVTASGTTASGTNAVSAVANRYYRVQYLGN